MKKVLTTLLSALTIGAGAADITWDFSRNITGDDDIITSQTLHAAYNAIGQDAVTVNGVTFNGAGTNVIVSSTGTFGDFLTDGPLLVPQISDDLEALLDSANWDVSEINIPNLTDGEEYTVQIWASDSRNGPMIGRKALFDGGAGAGGATVIQNVGGVAHFLGQYVLGTFTADGSNQVITVAGQNSDGSDNSGAGLVNAFAVYEGHATFKPEPPPLPGNIAWEPVGNIVGDSDVIDSLPLFRAENSGSETAVTVNGITFVPDVATTNGGASFAGFVYATATNDVFSSDYKDLLNPARYNNQNLTLENLTVGDEYTLQLWIADSRLTSPTSNIYRVSDNFGNGVDVKENTSSDDFGLNGEAGALGQYVIGTFTAGSTEQGVSITPVISRVGSSALINAWALYEGRYGPSDYDLWKTKYGITNPDADDDGDLLSNVFEYGVGGNPTNAMDTGTLPTFRVVEQEGASVIEVAHLVRASSLEDIEYTLLMRENLMTGSWTNASAVVTSGSIDATWDMATNTIPTDLPTHFFKVQIEEK